MAALRVRERAIYSSMRIWKYILGQVDLEADTRRGFLPSLISVHYIIAPSL